MKSLFNSVYFFWAVLALPMLPMIAGLFSGSQDAHHLLHPSGEYSARFMIFALMISPLQMMFPKAGWIMWLVRRRRALGVAAFVYAALHTVLYLVDKGSMTKVWAEFFALGIWTGWLALAIFVPLALTSNNSAQRALGPWWKRLQRLAYAAALLTLAHWIFIHNSFGGALSHFLPLAALQAYRVVRMLNKRALSDSAPQSVVR